MKVDLYGLLRDKIEEGLGWGIRHAYKYNDAPKTEDQLLEAVDRMMDDIMNAVCEYIRFDDDDEREV